jgi:hypothetical protein
VAGRTSGHVRRLSRHIEVHQVSANGANDEVGLTSVVWVNRAMRRGSSEGGGLQHRQRRVVVSLAAFRLVRGGVVAAGETLVEFEAISEDFVVIPAGCRRFADAQPWDSDRRSGHPCTSGSGRLPALRSQSRLCRDGGVPFRVGAGGTGAPAPARATRWRDIPAVRFATRRLSLRPVRSKRLYRVVEVWNFRPPVDGRVNVCIEAAVVSWSS